MPLELLHPVAHHPRLADFTYKLTRYAPLPGMQESEVGKQIQIGIIMPKLVVLGSESMPTTISLKE